MGVVLASMGLLMGACSSTKHVPEGKLLLDKVNISVTDNREVNPEDLYNYLRQTPNHKVLGFAKLQLGMYNLSGSDTTRRFNRWLRRVGQAPVIYDSILTETSRRQLELAMINRGYMEAHVTVDTIARHDKKKIDVNYNITTGQPRIISSFNFECDDPAIHDIVLADSSAWTITTNSRLDRNFLDTERTRLTTVLRNNGYYTFNKEYITFTADTIEGSKEVDLTMTIQPPRRPQHGDNNTSTEGEPLKHGVYNVRNIYFVTNYDPRQNGTSLSFEGCDSVTYKDITVLYGADHYLKPSILDEKCMIQRGKPYNAADVEKTYESLSQLGIVKFINIEMKPVAEIDGVTWMDAYVLLSRNKKQGVAVELEGTNSEGDLGFGVGLTYQHRNIARGSELLSAKLRASYESLSGDVDGIINNRYTEYAGEVGITIPKFQCPFLSRSFKQRMKASTEYQLSLNYQERPEYTRVIAGATWKFKWSTRSRGYNVRRTYDLLDINYVYLPKSTDFLEEIAATNPLLRYSYEDHFIMRMGYTYSITNRRIPTATVNAFAIQPSVTSFRTTVEMAGNLLYGISSLVGQDRSDGAYKIFGIQYSQYVKGDMDFNYTRNLNTKNALAFHCGFGIGYPYGNSSMIPFEKRFYAGGANGVRGWSVRTLGPGRYDSQNNVLDFINQCGDISLDLSMEYRAKLFWVFEGALFIDAGNIWTIKNYSTQPGGLFKFNEFYKEIALAYGIGLRMDFTYFLLRLDLGMKAHNPAINQEPWPLIHPNWSRDATFHFAVGYPF